MPGYSSQRTEDAESFGNALRQLFTTEMRFQVRFLYSDSPKESMLLLLPSAVGVAEDFLHLVIRCEYCCYGKRIPCTHAILCLQKKFLNPAVIHDMSNAVHEVYHGAPQADALRWADVDMALAQTPEAMELYYDLPFESHSEYISQLKRVAHEFPVAMEKTNKDSVSMQQIIEAGSSYKHYAYLQNASVFSAIAQGSPLSGTTSCEAEAKSLKNRGEAIYRQHADRVEVQEHVYGFYKLL